MNTLQHVGLQITVDSIVLLQGIQRDTVEWQRFCDVLKIEHKDIILITVWSLVLFLVSC